MDASLANVSKQPQASRAESYIALLHDRISNSTSLPSDLSAFISAVISESSGLVVSRQVLTEFCKATPSISDSQLRKQTIFNTIQLLQPRIVTFEEQSTDLRLQLAALCEADEEWDETAKVLMGIPLDSGHRVISDQFKLEIYIRIVRLLLEEDDAVTAESFFNRATTLIHSTTDKTTQLAYKLSQARILDSQRRFNDAGLKYHELSYIVDVAEEERLQALGAAVTCAILAPAGPQRSRLLATLYRDDRTQNLDAHPILAATFLDHIIKPSLIAGFEATLQPHQLARLPPSAHLPAGGMSEDDEMLPDTKAKRGPETVLDRAIMEHNLLSASKIYSNITFSGLGLLLSLTSFAAENMARNMIQQGRLKGSIDQVDRLIIFDAAPRELEGAVSNVAKAADALDNEDEADEEVTANETIRWDLSIRAAAQAVENLAQRAGVLMSATIQA